MITSAGVDESWIRSLAASIPDETDRVLISEAVAAALHGAPRLAVVGSWLAVAESLKRRFELLSHGDSEAGSVLRGVRDREERQQSADRFLVESAHRYGMTSVVEDQALSQLLESRHVFAHPYSETPTSEDVRTAPARAIEHLLSKPVLLRHRFVADEVDRVMGRVGWIGDSRLAVGDRVRVVVARTDPSVHRSWVTTLLRAAEPRLADPEFANGPLGRRVRWYADALIEKIGDEARAALDIESLLAAQPKAASLCLSTPLVFANLRGHARDAVLGELCAAVPAGDMHLDRLAEVRSQGGLTAEERERTTAALEGCAVLRLVGSAVEMEAYVHRLIDDLKSLNWYRQNPAIEAVRLAGPAKVAGLSEEWQETLGRNVLQSAQGGARKAITLLGDIPSDPDSWPDGFIFGLVAECLVNERGGFRIKHHHLEGALYCLRGLPADRSSVLLDRLLQKVEEATLWARDEHQEDAAIAIAVILGSAGAALAESVREKPVIELPF